MNLQERIKNLKKVKENWETYCQLVGSDQTSQIIDKETKLIGEIDATLPFKDQEEKEKWLGVLFGYKFWEDFEDLTNSIIEREEEELTKALCKFEEFAHYLANQTTFKNLFNSFKSVEKEWVDTMDNFKEWWKKQSPKDKAEFKENYREFYEEEFSISKIMKDNYYGFELCCIPNFFKDNEDGKGDLMECIFERYCDIFEFDGIEFYSALIKEILKGEKI